MTHRYDSFAIADAYNLHHSPGAICVVCSINSLAESVYLLIDNQEKLSDAYPEPSYLKLGDNAWAIKTLSSSATQSIQYLLENILRDETPEFEAYLSISRNLLEKLAKLTEIYRDEKSLAESSGEFVATIEDVTTIFECRDLTKQTTEMKRAKFLGKGTNLKNLPEDRYRLAFAYLSRVMHSYNMDSLLHPASDRFLVKGYMLILISGLYHEVSGNLLVLSEPARSLHSKTHNMLDNIWSKKQITPETLIYWTTFYDDTHRRKEKDVLISYKAILAKSVKLYKDKGAIMLPQIKIVNDKPTTEHPQKQTDVPNL